MYMIYTYVYVCVCIYECMCVCRPGLAQHLNFHLNCNFNLAHILKLSLNLHPNLDAPEHGVWNAMVTYNAMQGAMQIPRYKGADMCW